jgi:hypothetical protein
MKLFAKAAAVFLSLSVMDVALTLFGGDSRGLREINPFMIDGEGELVASRLVIFNPIAGLVFAGVVSWLCAGAVGRSSAAAQVDIAAFRAAFAASGRAQTASARRVQILVALAAGLLIGLFPVLNNTMQILTPDMGITSHRNVAIAGAAVIGSTGVSLWWAPRLLAWLCAEPRVNCGPGKHRR